MKQDCPALSCDVLDAIPDMVLVKGQRSRILWANRAFREAYGMSNEELQGQVDAPFVAPELTHQYMSDDARVFLTGETVVIPDEPLTQADGRRRRVHTTKSPVFDENGTVVMLVAVIRDITEHLEPTRSMPRASLAPRPAGRRGKVLVIDDDPMVAAAFERVLRSEHEVVSLSDPDEALQRLRDGERFDAIVCDALVCLSGADIYTRLVDAAPDQVDRVVFVTGDGLSPTTRALRARSKNPILDKPFAAHELRSVVRHVVG